jgi:hypothetical protein
LHATGGHLVSRQETSRQEVCKKLNLHHNYIFSIGKSTSSAHASDYLPDEPWFGNCAGTMDDIARQKKIMHTLAVSCLQSRQFLQARCENNYLNKKMKTSLTNLRIYATNVLISDIHRHCAWPDAISKNGTFNLTSIWINYISFSAHSSGMNSHLPAD